MQVGGVRHRKSLCRTPPIYVGVRCSACIIFAGSTPESGVLTCRIPIFLAPILNTYPPRKWGGFGIANLSGYMCHEITGFSSCRGSKNTFLFRVPHLKPALRLLISLATSCIPHVPTRFYECRLVKSLKSDVFLAKILMSNSTTDRTNSNRSNGNKFSLPTGVSGESFTEKN